MSEQEKKPVLSKEEKIAQVKQKIKDCEEELELCDFEVGIGMRIAQRRKKEEVAKRRAMVEGDIHSYNELIKAIEEEGDEENGESTDGEESSSQG